MSCHLLFFKPPAGFGMDGDLFGGLLPTPNRGVNVQWIELDPVANSARSFSSEQS
jgi:hypothetical protein